MIWKTDWQPGDDYARDGAGDLNRLIANYLALRDMLNEYGYAISFAVPTTDGYRTMPFADLLNQVETALEALEVWQIAWPDNKAWQPAGTGPSYEDINRWESCGAEIEATAARVASAWIHSGTTHSGQGGIRI